MKEANIVPLPKVKDPCSLSDFRPISLTNTIAKIMESLVEKWIKQEVKGKIDPKQYASFRKSSSTFAMVDMLQSWTQSLENQRHMVRICYLDYSKAFDKIDHTILLSKLIKLGINTNLIKWVAHFLFNRKQRVVIDNAISSWRTVIAGVPQGTKLGPILFVLMFNDLHTIIRNSHFIFMDDTTISEHFCHKNITNSTLQSDLDEIYKWSQRNKMELNIKKCKEMRIVFSKSEIFIPPLNINNVTLEVVTSYKSLGLTLLDTLKWDSHIDDIISKASKRLHLMRVLCRYGATTEDLKRIYISLIRSCLEFSCIVWEGWLTEKLKMAIESVQKRALRIILPFTHYDDALKCLGIGSLEDRRKQICRKFGSEVTNEHHKLHHLVPNIHSHGYETRHKNRLTFKCRTTRMENSPIVHCIRLNNQSS